MRSVEKGCNMFNPCFVTLSPKRWEIYPIANGRSNDDHPHHHTPTDNAIGMYIEWKNPRWPNVFEMNVDTGLILLPNVEPG